MTQEERVEKIKSYLKYTAEEGDVISMWNEYDGSYGTIQNNEDNELWYPFGENNLEEVISAIKNSPDYRTSDKYYQYDGMQYITFNSIWDKNSPFNIDELAEYIEECPDVFEDWIDFNQLFNPAFERIKEIVKTHIGLNIIGECFTETDDVDLYEFVYNDGTVWFDELAECKKAIDNAPDILPLACFGTYAQENEELVLKIEIWNKKGDK